MKNSLESWDSVERSYIFTTNFINFQSRERIPNKDCLNKVKTALVHCYVLEKEFQTSLGRELLLLEQEKTGVYEILSSVNESKPIRNLTKPSEEALVYRVDETLIWNNCTGLLEHLKTRVR